MEEDEFVHTELTSLSFFVSIGDIPLCSEGKRGRGEKDTKCTRRDGGGEKREEKKGPFSFHQKRAYKKERGKF